jgi:hypothetical protein
MDIVGGMGAEDLHHRFLLRGIAQIDPKQQSAARQLLLDPLSVMAMQHAAEQRTDRRTAAGDDYDRQCAGDAGENHGTDKGEAERKAVFGFDSRHPGKEGLARRRRLVLQLRDAPVAMAELALDRGLVGQQAEGGAIEAVRLEREDGRLELLGIVERGNGLTDRPGHGAELLLDSITYIPTNARRHRLSSRFAIDPWRASRSAREARVS